MYLSIVQHRRHHQQALKPVNNAHSNTNHELPTEAMQQDAQTITSWDIL